MARDRPDRGAASHRRGRAARDPQTVAPAPHGRGAAARARDREVPRPPWNDSRLPAGRFRNNRLRRGSMWRSPIAGALTTMPTLARPIGLGLAARGDPEDAVEWARRARDAGLDSVWTHDSYFERD